MVAEASDDIIPLSRFRAQMSRPRGKDRLDALLSAEDAREQIAALSVPELYFLVKDVGFADCQELLELATPGQYRGCIDLDSWDRDRVQIEAAVPWLAAACDAGYETLGRVWRALDGEMSALLLSRMTQIYDLQLGDEFPDDDERPAFTTPDTFFILAVQSEEEHEIALVQRVIDFLYRDDGHLARRTIMAARSETLSYLEEMSYRWRTGRMADLGYVDMYEALEVFRPLDPEQVTADEGTAPQHSPAAEGDEARTPGHLPTPVLDPVSGVAFLAKTLSTITDAKETTRLEAEILFLVNRVLSAARVSPGNEDAVQIGALHATSTLSLGLEHLSQGDTDRARAFLSGVALVRLHRVGYTLTLRVSRFARSLVPWARALTGVSDDVLSALLGPRPFFPEALTGGVDIRPFASRADLALVADHLRKLGVRVAVAEALGATPPTEEGDPQDLDTHVRTALVRTIAGESLTAAPLTAAHLRFFASKLSEGRIPDAVRADAANALAGCLARANASHGIDLLPTLLNDWLHTLEESLGALDPAEPPDPNYLAGVVLCAE